MKRRISIHAICNAACLLALLASRQTAAEEGPANPASDTETVSESPADPNPGAPAKTSERAATTSVSTEEVKQPTPSTSDAGAPGVSAPKTPAVPASELPNPMPLKRFGVLEVHTQPEGATVSLGGDSPEFEQRLGKTPLRTEVDPGKVVLSISLEGYETATAEIDVETGKTAVMQIKLDKKTARSNKNVRMVGHLLFWPGILTAGTGIALIAADDPKKSIDTGMPGFITAGIGTAMIIAGGLILGLTFHDKTPYAMPTVSMAVPPDGDGGGVMIQKTF